MGAQIPLGTETTRMELQIPTHLGSPCKSFHDQPEDPGIPGEHEIIRKWPNTWDVVTQEFGT